MQGVKQLALELATPPAPTLDNFVVGGNAEIVASLRALVRSEGERFIYLWGASGSGRTHLLRATLQELRAAGRSVHEYSAPLDEVADQDALGVDNVQFLDAAKQIELFNIYNMLRDGSGLLVATGSAAPAQLPLRSDLQTRLAWGLVYEVRTLSEADRRTALLDYARARGFALADEVADYLLVRVPRDMNSLRALVDAMDRLSLEQKRAVTVPLARELLQARTVHTG